MLTIQSSHEATVTAALGGCIRVLVLSMVCRLLGISPDAAKALLKRLERRGHICKRSVRAKVIPPLTHPLAKGKPGAPPPHPGKISYLAKKRFRELRPETITAYFATDKLLHLYGTPLHGAFKPEQVSHDLGVSEMWLFMLRRWPKLTARCFEGEDRYAAENLKFEKLPDARLVHRRTREVFLYLEFAGAYRADRLADLQADLAQRIEYWIF